MIEIVFMHFIRNFGMYSKSMACVACQGVFTYIYINKVYAGMHCISLQYNYISLYIHI